MDKQDRLESKLLIKKLAHLCAMRDNMLARQQTMLSRSVNLARFVRLAALDHVRHSPELHLAKKYLGTMVPHLSAPSAFPLVDSGLLHAGSRGNN
jgi:hypothetical protein